MPDVYLIAVTHCRAIRWALCCILIIAMQAATAQANISGTVTVYTNRKDLIDNGSFNRWTADFERTHPGTSVKVIAASRYAEEMAERFTAREYGDVMLVPTDMPKSAYGNFFLPLNDLGLSDQLYFTKVWENDGKQYAFSQGVIAEGLVYNKAIFNRFNVKPPKTLSEFYNLCALFKKNGITPVALNIGAGWPLQQWDKLAAIIADDPSYYEKMIEDIQPFSTGKPYATSLGIANTIFNRGYSEEDFILDSWGGSKKLFAEGKIAMFFLGSWSVPQIIEQGISSQQVGFVPFPYDDSGNARALLSFDWGLAVSKYSKNPDAAKAFLRYLLAESNLADTSGFIPTLKSRNSGLEQLKEFMEYKPKNLTAEGVSSLFTRTTTRAGIDFMNGNYIRDVMISPDFSGSMRFWNRRWKQSVESIRSEQANAHKK
jgi:raffinose/stachyose/melibiose transport system substrate-binding protein